MAADDIDVRIQGSRIVVAVEGHVNDWAAYQDRITRYNRANNPYNERHWSEGATLDAKIYDTVDNGDKISWEEASYLFPDWVDRLAWRQ